MISSKYSRGEKFMNQIIEETRFELDKEFTARPLEHKGLNRHFINLVSADVFKPKKTGFFVMVKNIFSSVK